jgi:hypothetical protein
MSAVSFAAYLKATAINIIRAAAYQNREVEGEPAPVTVFFMIVCAVKERVHCLLDAIRHPSWFSEANMEFAALYAA